MFGVFKKLATAKGISKAPLETVFRLTVLEGHSQAKTANLCGCVAPLISRRVKTIEARFGMSVELLLNFAPPPQWRAVRRICSYAGVVSKTKQTGGLERRQPGMCAP